jgi:hypothetical protein
MANIFARVLQRIEAFGVECEHLIHGPEAAIKALAEAGLVDPHPEAVAYAKEAGVPVKKLDDPQAAKELGSAMTETPEQQ